MWRKPSPTARSDRVELPVGGEEPLGDHADHHPGDRGRQEVDRPERCASRTRRVSSRKAIPSGITSANGIDEQEQRVVLEHPPERRVVELVRVRRRADPGRRDARPTASSSSRPACIIGQPEQRRDEQERRQRSSRRPMQPAPALQAVRRGRVGAGGRSARDAGVAWGTVSWRGSQRQGRSRRSGEPTRTACGVSCRSTPRCSDGSCCQASFICPSAFGTASILPARTLGSNLLPALTTSPWVTLSSIG